MADYINAVDRDEVIAKTTMALAQMLYKMKPGDTLTITRREDEREMFHIKGGKANEESRLTAIINALNDVGVDATEENIRVLETVYLT